MTDLQAQERAFVIEYLRRNGTAYDDDAGFHRAFADAFGLPMIRGGRWDPILCWRARTVLKQMSKGGDLSVQHLTLHGGSHRSRIYRLRDRRHGFDTAAVA